VNEKEKWFSTLDEETSKRGVVPLISEWSHINTRTDHYKGSPYGDYSTVTNWYWDDVETDSDKDYFMLQSSFRIMPGSQQYGSLWWNYRGHIHHDWKYYGYPGTRDLWDSQPRDEKGENTISITLTGGVVSLTWPTAIPDYELDDQSDYVRGVAKWEEKINYNSPTCGRSTHIVDPGSAMHCSQADARSGEWVGLALFKSKPVWIILEPAGFRTEYTPGYWGYTNCVRWTGSEYETPPDCPADLNNDGYRNFDDVLELVANWGPCTGCSEDLNNDGYVNYDDVLVIVANWGPCPP